jgi:hypothetical protein
MHMLVQSRRSSYGAPNINAKRLAVSFSNVLENSGIVDSPTSLACVVISALFMAKKCSAHRSSSHVQSS